MQNFATQYPKPLTPANALAGMAELLALAGKTRKGSGAPYICHLASVVGIIASKGGKNNLQLAGVFHDALEDLDWDAEDVAILTNDKVAEMVAEVSEDKKLLWADRKAATVELAATCCQGVLTLLIADKLDNLLSMNRECGQPGYWERFNAGRNRQLAFAINFARAARLNPKFRTRKYPELGTVKLLNEFELATIEFERLTTS